MVTSATLKNLTDTMKMMAAAERLVGDFYRDCAEIWEEDGAFWLEIAAEEEKHATQLERMAQILTLKPERFETGRPFNRTGIQTFMNGIEGLRQRLKEGMITRERAVFAARDVEASVLEKCYHEFLRTSDTEYLTLVNGITQETGDHKDRIEKRIQELKAGR